jgi:hypothetical protein
LLKDLENVKYYGYDSTGSGKKSSEKDQEKVINAFANNKEKDKYNSVELKIPKGTKGTITVSIPAEIDAVDIRAATKYEKIYIVDWHLLQKVLIFMSIYRTI